MSRHPGPRRFHHMQLAPHLRAKRISRMGCCAKARCKIPVLCTQRQKLPILGFKITCHTRW
ncbi:hypothetical protein FOYG_17632 [Fusarium oxysporum NRRL 32931]|uniref:Uncharacterized protein n=1 Tax=Fusarium oxysporum NRRL 32931 TaxID=660029 RepID=W9HA97_FUSOX|nr:hypothetical protein FOYG_17632 [Fusarium oxysporum NRRL 32931]